MNNLINFIYDLKNVIRYKQGKENNSVPFVLNNVENEINQLKIGDFSQYYTIVDNQLYLTKFDAKAMGIDFEKYIKKEGVSPHMLSYTYTTTGRFVFYGQPYLTELKNFENLNIDCGSTLGTAHGIFCVSSCGNLHHVNFYNWNFINWKVNSAYPGGAFRDDRNLQTVDLSNWNISIFANMNGLFAGCYSLEDVYLNNWDLSLKDPALFWDHTFDNVPSSCRVWVKDGVAYNSIKSVYPSLDVKPHVVLGGAEPQGGHLMEGTFKKYSIPFYGTSPDIKEQKLRFNQSLSDPVMYYDPETHMPGGGGNPIINYETNTIDFCVKANFGDASRISFLDFTLYDTEGNEWSFRISFEVTPYIDRGYEVSNIDGASYGFSLNSNEYYESQNKGVQSSYAICKVEFWGADKIIFDCINYAESNYDFGILSKVDETLSLSSSEDTTGVFKSFKGQQSSKVVSITYEGEDWLSDHHFIYVKYIKDTSVNENNDTLQFKIRFE